MSYGTSEVVLECVIILDEPRIQQTGVCADHFFLNGPIHAMDSATLYSAGVGCPHMSMYTAAHAREVCWLRPHQNSLDEWLVYTRCC